MDLAHALAALRDGCGGRKASTVDMEIHVTDKPFWWNNSLTDRDMSRLVAAMPPNVQVRGHLLTAHKMRCMTVCDHHFTPVSMAAPTLSVAGHVCGRNLRSSRGGPTMCQLLFFEVWTLDLL